MNLNEKRIIVTAWYPGCLWEEGDILTLQQVPAAFLDKEYEDELYYHNFKDGAGCYAHVSEGDAEKATKNFRQMDWWEDRKLSELAEYVSHNHNGVLYYGKAEWWALEVETNIPHCRLSKPMILRPDWHIRDLPANHSTPATLTDYEQFKKNEQ